IKQGVAFCRGPVSSNCLSIGFRFGEEDSEIAPDLLHLRFEPLISCGLIELRGSFLGKDRLDTIGYLPSGFGSRRVKPERSAVGALLLDIEDRQPVSCED